MTRPTFTLEAGFGAGLQTPAGSITWTDITNEGMSGTTTNGRAYELAAAQAGTLNVLLDNLDGRFTPPGPAGSLYAGQVLLLTPVRLRATYSGSSYVVWQGYVDRWPIGFDSSGIWQQSPLEASDLLAFLSLIQLLPVIGDEVMSDLPMAYWPCSDPSGSSTLSQTVSNGPVILPYRDYANQYDPLPQFGITLPTLVGAGFDTTTGVGTGSGITLPAAAVPVVAGKYARFNFRAPIPTSVLTSSCTIEAWIGSDCRGGALLSGSDSVFLGTTPSTGYLTASIASAPIGGTPQAPTVATSTVPVCDGPLHHVVLVQTVASGSLELQLYVDGALAVVELSVQTPAASKPVLQLGDSQGLDGDQTFAQVAVYPTALSAGRVAAHYFAGQTGRAGETSDQRVTALLRYAGYPVPATIGAGASTMGPADLAGKSLLDALQAVATSENGYLGVIAGQLVFDGRYSRYNQTPTWTFGGNTGELPYTALTFDYDSTYLYNDVTVTRVTGIVVHVSDPASIGQYGLRTLAVTSGVDTDTEAIAAAQYLLERYSQPALRVDSLTITPSSNPALWPCALGAKVGDVATVNSRAADGQLITGNYFIESVAVTGDLTSGVWTVTFQMSPAAGETFWLLGDSVYGVLGSTTRLAY